MGTSDPAKPSIGEVLIRLIQPDDLDVCEKLRADTVTDALGPDTEDWPWDRYDRGVVAELDQRVIGTVSTIIPGAPRYWFERHVPLGSPGFPPDLTRDNLCEIEDLSVHPDYRGHKIGIALAAAIPFVQRGLGAIYVIGSSGPQGRGIADRMGATETGIQFHLGDWTLHIACARVEDNCLHGGQLLDQLVADGRVRLGPTVQKLVAGEAASIPPVS